MERMASRRWEVGLVAALTALTAAALVLVERTPQGTDRYVWLAGALVAAAGAVAWRVAKWPARPWVVLPVSVLVVAVGIGLWTWWLISTRTDMAV